MKSEWTTLPLEDCMAAIIDYRGKSPEKTTFGIPLVTAKIVKGGRIEEPAEFIAEEAFDEWMSRGMPKPGDIVMTTEAPLGEVAQLDDRKVALAQRIITLRGKADILDNTFLKFLLQSTPVQDELRSRATGTTVLGIRQSELRKVPLTFPPLAEQKAIARILGTVDDKIELNRRMNATLEAMARALFQSWFVDALPDDGSLPEGWELSTIGTEAKVVGGSTPSTKSPEFWDNGEFHWVTPKDFSALQSKVLIGSSRKVTKAGLNQISSGMLPENTVLLSSRAPVGYLALTKIETAINQGFIAMICPRRLSPEYVMLWADSIMDQIKQAASGTTFAEISKSTFRPFPIIVPSADRLKQFTDIVRAFYERISANERQSVTLAETRDTLLPKFLSGELRTEEVANAG